MFFVAVAFNCINAHADIEFTGNLLDRPCQIDPTSQSLDVEFLNTPVQQFRVEPGRGSTKLFSIKLLHCQPNIVGKVVKLNFTGETESNLSGTLRVTGENAGKLAIQLIDSDGRTPLAIGADNNAGHGQLLTQDNIQLNFGAYVQATPSALKNRSVTPGGYSATTTFMLSYE